LFYREEIHHVNYFYVRRRNYTSYTRTYQSSGILKKGEAYAAEKKIEPAVLLNARLFPDMYPLLRQVQLASTSAKAQVPAWRGLRFQNLKTLKSPLTNCSAHC